MTAEEMLVLTEKLADMHASLYGYERTISEKDLADFIKIEYARVGTSSMITQEKSSGTLSSCWTLSCKILVRPCRVF